VYLSSLEKHQLSIKQFFSSNFVRCTPLINIFGSNSGSLSQQNSRLFISTTSLAPFV